MKNIKDYNLDSLKEEFVQSHLEQNKYLSGYMKKKSKNLMK